MYAEIFAGLGRDAAELVTVVAGAGHDEMIMVRDIPLASLCEHHLTPFLGHAHVAYVPNRDGRITGLSKIARVVDLLSRRPQVQERLTTEIADALERALEPRGVFVMIEAEHLCMTMRGIKKPGSVTVTSAVRGVFRSDARTRAEALELVRRSARG
jgi:GTP cyclohydrolase I